MESGTPLPVICLGGPTGSGKTGIALEIAAALDCEIINADSRQVYADFPIITAQPDESERARVAHYLYGFMEATQKIAAGTWVRLAVEQARKIIARGKTPLLVGGTGLYFQALLRGIATIPPVNAEISQKVEERMANEGPEALHAELALKDAAYAARVHPRDRQRIMRALEVVLATGRPFSWWHEHAMPPPLCFGPMPTLNPSLEWLAPRLEARIDAMLKMGALAEAEAALAKCANVAAPGWSGIGCAEIAAFLRGDIDINECRKQWFANTRAYAKRQLTWFRQRREAFFFEAANVAGIIDYCQKHVPAALRRA